MSKSQEILERTQSFEATSDQLSAINALVKVVTEKHKKRAKLEEELKELSWDIRKMEEDLIPQAMSAANMDNVSGEGYSIKIKEIINGSIPSQTKIFKEKDEDKKSVLQAKRDSAFAYLSKKGGKSLIKNSVKTIFGKEEEDSANKLAESLIKEGYEVDVEKSVHSATLSSWMREQLEEDPSFDIEPLNGRKIKIAQVKLA